MSDCKRGTEAPLAFRPSADSAPVRTLVDLGPSIANPGPLGLFAFSLTTVFLSCANAGLVEIDFEAVVWCYALAWGGATQWVAGILEFFKKNIFGATVFCTYGAFWVGLAIFKFAVAGKALTLSGSIQGGMALYFSAWGVLSIVYFIGSLRVSVALAAIFVPLILAFFTLVGGQYSTASLRAGGWFGIMAAAIAFYLGAAQFLNEMYQSEVLPVGDLSRYWQQRKVGSVRRGPASGGAPTASHEGQAMLGGEAV